MAEFTQQQYSSLCAAISQGALRVKYGDKEVEYRDLPEMLRIKAMMERSLGITKASRTKYIQHTKGLQ